MSGSNPLVVPDTVYAQLEATRRSGYFNMLTEIEDGLDKLEFREALDWVQENKRAYIEYARAGGFIPESDTPNKYHSQFDTLDDYATEAGGEA